MLHHPNSNIGRRIGTKPLISSKLTANRMGIADGTLAKWRVYGQGPAFLKVGRRVAYDPDVVDAWLEEQVRHSTSEAA